MMLLNQHLEILSSLNRQIEFLKQLFNNIIQEMKHQRVIQMNHFIREIKTFPNEWMIEHQLLFSQFQVNVIDLLLAVSQEEQIPSICLVNDQFLR
jgi:hypothetical protein